MNSSYGKGKKILFSPENVIFAVEMLKFLHENGISFQK